LKVLQIWDGHADPESPGLPLIVEFRKQLAVRLLSPLFTRCRAVDPEFTYRWPNLDLPLQRLLSEQPWELAGRYGDYPDWKPLIVAILEQSARELDKRHRSTSVETLNWGRENRVAIAHPLGDAIPLPGGWLGMPDEPLPGCSHCVRVAVPGFGASARMVVSPGHEDRAILHMPAGQSGHPLSDHYRDQQDAWLKGLPTTMRAGKGLSRLQLNPVIRAP
jgi:penicillin amidase